MRSRYLPRHLLARGDRSSYEIDRWATTRFHSPRSPCAHLPGGVGPSYGDDDHTFQEGHGPMTTQVHDQAARHDPVYDRLHAMPEFTELRKRYRGFVFPATVAFLAWYLLYVVMSMWAGDFMDTKVVGNINVALVFGLLQFLTTFGLAWVYSSFSTKKLDPLARVLNDEYEKGKHNGR
jgi:uncharacterized membrane protein (DUF485 family)